MDAQVALFWMHQQRRGHQSRCHKLISKEVETIGGNWRIYFKHNNHQHQQYWIAKSFPRMLCCDNWEGLANIDVGKCSNISQKCLQRNEILWAETKCSIWKMCYAFCYGRQIRQSNSRRKIKHQMYFFVHSVLCIQRFNRGLRKSCINIENRITCIHSHACNQKLIKQCKQIFCNKFWQLCHNSQSPQSYGEFKFHTSAQMSWKI